jgi:PPK2 family polyphosphate:nucleotide phosphotransferase
VAGKHDVDFVDGPYRVPFDGGFRVAKAATEAPQDAPGKKALEKHLARSVEALDALQRILYAHDNHAVLLVFQAMDGAGKDSTIRAVLSGIDPAGCQVFSFKTPSPEELEHDFLWRTTRCLPERGRIGVFNRSYYEEVLVVRVHPEYLQQQRVAHPPRGARLWQERYESIRDHERHLARNGTVILKFFLNVSRQEQKRRFLARLDEPEKNWKFNAGDVAERARWPDYMRAYEEALNATSRPWAPWYAIPADDKRFMRATVAQIVVARLQQLDLRYPEPAAAERKRFAALRRQLAKD